RLAYFRDFRSSTRTPPHPTRLPYTTLFRSDRRAKSGRGRGLDRGRGSLALLRRGRLGALSVWGNSRPILRDHPLDRDPSLANHKDRKSTRLNSSHVKISYAVFCLKKKTTSE